MTNSLHMDLGHVALLIAAGEEAYVISQGLGHASIRTTYDTYDTGWKAGTGGPPTPRSRPGQASRGHSVRSEPPSLGL